VTKSGALAFPKAQFAFVDTEWNYWTGSRYESEVNSSPMPDQFKKGTIGAARDNLPAVANRTRFVKQGGEITTGRELYCGARTFAVPCHDSCSPRARNSSCIWATIAHNPVTSLQHPEWTAHFRLRSRAGDQVAQGHSGPPSRPTGSW